MKIAVFEDSKCYNLGPLNYLRHTSEILNGAFSLLDKIIKFKHSKISGNATLFCRNEIAFLLQEKYPGLSVNELSDDDYILINSRIRFDPVLIKEFIKYIGQDKDLSYISNEDQVIIHISRDKITRLRNYFADKGNYLIDIDMINKLDHYHAPMSSIYKLNEYAWDYIKHHEEELRNDLELIRKKPSKEKYNARFINKKNVILSEGCMIYPNVTLDADNGIIFIGNNVIIEPNVFIKGPVYIDKNCVLKSGTVLYGPVTIGHTTKINGEISSSILHSYVNKQHYGFLGHSYVCEWVNLGAGTTTSNLKNNYSNITIKTNRNEYETSSNFLGSIIGDHTKTGIHTILNTGSLIGISCNLFGSNFHKKTVGSFSWDNSENNKTETYEIEKALSTVKTSMSRRNVKLNQNYEKTLRELFKNRNNLFI